MLSFILPIALLQGPGFALHDGDRVLFYGDSITDNQFYPQFVETYVVTRFPKLKVAFMNYGWSGDKVGGGGGGDIGKRLGRDVFPNRPTVVTIMLGMNDGLYRTWSDGTFNEFRAGYEHILDELKSHGNPRVTLIKPSPYDDVTLPPNLTEGGYNVVLQRFGDYLGQLGQKIGATVVDFNSPVVEMLQKAKAFDSEAARRLIPDRVHPGPATHMVMGAALLKGWNATALVSSTVIDASVSKAGQVQNATVRDVKPIPSGLSWRELENSLPLSIDRNGQGVGLVLKSSKVLEDLDQEPLKVVNLPAGTYRLVVDGEEVGRFSSDALSYGINLAELNTPQTRQAAEVSMWTSRRQFLRQTSWRNVEFWFDGLDLKQRDQAVAAMEKLEAEIVDRQHKAAQPAWHTYSVERVVNGKSRKGG